MAELSPSWLQLVVVAVGLAQVRPVQAMQPRADPVCLLPLDMSRDAWLLLVATHSQLTCRYTPRSPHVGRCMPGTPPSSRPPSAELSGPCKCDPAAPAQPPLNASWAGAMQPPSVMPELG